MPEISVKTSWRGMISRLQTLSQRGRCAVLSVTFVVDDNGDILFFSKPARTDLEPSRARETIIALFSDQTA